MNTISITSIYKTFFVIYILFYMTTLKFSWGLTPVSTIFNASLFILVVTGVFHGLANSKFDHRSRIFLVLVAFLCFSSMLNLFLNFSFLGVMQLSVYLLPWLVLTMVLTNKEVSLRNYKSYWSWFNSFLVIICFIGLCEYIAIFTFGYRPPIIELDTGMGEYYVGYFTLLQKIDGIDIPYFRFQGPFGESGDLAMWASVFMVYNLFRRQYVYAAVLAVAIFGAFSPSSYISLFVAFLVYLRTRSAWILPVMLTIVCLAIVIFMSDIVSIYNDVLVMKAFSIADRVSTNLDFIYKLPFLLNSYPFGVPFFESTIEKIRSGVGFSASYGPIGSYMMGGLTAFLVYIVLILYGLFLSGYKILLSKGRLIENELYVYYLMLFTYVVQRGTFMDYEIFPLLFAPLFFGKVEMKGDYRRLQKLRNVLS